MYLTIQGLVLRVTPYKEYDALLTILTHTHGKLTVKARGLRRKNSPLIAPCQLLAYSVFTLFENRGYYTVNEASATQLFQELRRDLQKLTLGTYFAQVAEVLCQEDIPNPELLSLVLNSMYAMSKMHVSESIVKSAFELRVACLAGYLPDLSGCVNCGNSSADRFDLSAGTLVCTSCIMRDSSGIRMPVTPGVLETMRYICTCDSKHIFSFQIGEDTQNLLSQLTESYLTIQLERGFSTLDFYKTLLID